MLQMIRRRRKRNRNRDVDKVMREQITQIENSGDQIRTVKKKEGKEDYTKKKPARDSKGTRMDI